MPGDDLQRAPRPLRVALLTHTAEVGGAELAMARLLGALPAHVEPTVILGADGPLVQHLARLGVAVRIEPMPAGARARSRTAAARNLSVLGDAAALVPYLWRLRRLLAGERPDVVCSNSLKGDLIALPLCWSLRLPLVWFVHDRIAPDYLPRSTVRLIRGVVRLVSGGVIANSRATAETLPQARRMTIAYPGYSPEQVGPEPSDRGPSSRPLVGLLGRISPTKGQLEFVRAAAVVRAERADVQFVVAGAPLFGAEEYADLVRAEVDRLGLGDVVRFVGPVADPRVFLDSLSIAVHASPLPEPFGQVVVEAMIRGVPVLATRGGGMTEIMTDGDRQLGWLVAPGDSAALAAAIIAMLDDPGEAVKRAHAAYDSALTRFPLERTAKATVEAWLWALGRRPDQRDTRVSVYPH